MARPASRSVSVPSQAARTREPRNGSDRYTGGEDVMLAVVGPGEESSTTAYPGAYSGLEQVRIPTEDAVIAAR